MIVSRSLEIYLGMRRLQSSISSSDEELLERAVEIVHRIGETSHLAAISVLNLPEVMRRTIAHVPDSEDSHTGEGDVHCSPKVAHGIRPVD